MNYLQFKLSTGDEIVCEVVDEPEDDDPNIVIRNAMKVFTIEGPDGTRYHTFRPWMTYQDRQSYLQLLNVNHIVGESKPSEMLVQQFMKAIQNENERGEEREAVLEEQFKDIKKKLEAMLDSQEPNNVIQLFNVDKDKMH